MFKITDNRLISSGISITLPKGLYLANWASETGLIFTDEHLSFKIKVITADLPMQTEEDIKKQALDLGMALQKQVKRIAFNGLRGFSYVYKDFRSEYYELKLQNAKDLPECHICITVETESSKASLKEVLLKPEVIDFFCNLRCD